MSNSNKTKIMFEQSLLKILENKNYHDITINEICSLAKKTKMTFYHYYKDKDHLLAESSINLINNEYNEEYNKILSNETDIDEIEYQSIAIVFEWVNKHYKQIKNLSYKGETIALEIFKKALFDNYRNYLTNVIIAGGYDIPSDYISIFCFEGLYNAGLYYAEQLNSNKDKKKVKEEGRKVCHFLAETIVSTARYYQTKQR